MEILTFLAAALSFSMAFVSIIFLYNKYRGKETSIYLAWFELAIAILLTVLLVILTTAFKLAYILPLILTVTLIPLYVKRLKIYFK